MKMKTYAPSWYQYLTIWKTKMKPVNLTATAKTELRDTAMEAVQDIDYTDIDNNF